jgi:2-polyprenyl-6-methoxyphenol hydroxylase-like FAD-dependent oxidoreductase
METQVTVVGAGPVGLMLAGELRLAGADVVVCESRTEPSGESRGVGFTRRCAEVFDQRGLLDRLGDVEIGRQTHFGGVRIDTDLLDDNHFGVRGVAQHRIETMLEKWVTELGAVVLRGHELVGLRDRGDAVIASLADHEDVASAYLVGCDGARSTVRRLVGIDFPGHPATRGAYVADIAGRDIRPRAIGERVPGGMVMAVRLEEGVDRIVIHPDSLPPRDLADLTFDEIADAWARLTGESLHDADVRWISCFTDSSRQAAQYRRGRVFLAGDAAHIHIPAGAQGLSVGVQDAVNLGWKLGAVVTGHAPESLVDSYHTERHPVGERLLRNTRAQAQLYLTGDRMEPLRHVLGELFGYPEAARRMAGKVSGLDIRYDMHVSGHPLVGSRLPTDWRVALADGGEVSVAQLLHPARGVLITTGDHHGVVTDRVDVVRGTWAPTGDRQRQWGLTAVLVRPDGHVAWAAPGCGDIRPALARWFGTA